MTTALDLITGAARLLQVVRKGEALAADEAVDGLNALNDMFASWSNSSLMVRQRTLESFSISAAASYTIGSGQTLNTTNPSVIKEASINIAGGDYPLQVLTDEQYADIFLKTLSTNIPEYINYDNGFPIGTIKLYPRLNTSATLNLLTEKPGVDIAALSTTLVFAPGMKRAARFNLAIEIAGEYGVTIPPQVALIARTSRAAIELQIAKNRPMRLKVRPYVKPNIYSGIA